MGMIEAVYKDGVFRPIAPVDLPDGCHVMLDAQRADEHPDPTDPRFAHLSGGWAEVYAVLSRRHDGGPIDGAARRDEHGTSIKGF